VEKSAVKAVEKGMKKQVAITAKAPAWEKKSVIVDLVFNFLHPQCVPPRKKKSE